MHVNDATSARTVALDLSGFGEVADGATVTPVVTSADSYLVEGDPVAVEAGDGAASATLTVPAESVTTFVVDGVSGVADDAPLVQEGHVYRIDGVQSDRSLAPAGDGLQIATDDAAADQLWTLTDLGAPEGWGSHRARYAVTNVATGEQLAVDTDTSAVLVEASADPADAPEAARWILSTTGDGTYTLVNASSGTLLEVGGGATTDGSPVGTYRANSGANQRWEIVDETLLGTEPVDVFTTPGAVPLLPETVTPVYPDGAGDALPVVWDVPGDDAWAEAGTVEVTGTVADPAGGTVAATATVTVDVLDSTRTASASTYVGGEPELPATVTAVTAGGVDVERAVTWQEATDGVYDEIGVVQLSGTADAGAGGTLPATVRVLVTEPGEANAATADGTTVSATYTEPGYPADRVVDGDRSDKGWSNWRSGDKNPTDTLTVNLPRQRDVTGVDVYFYVDGSHPSWARSVQLEAHVDGVWQAVGDPVEVTQDGGAPVAEVAADVRSDAVRVVLTAQEATHLVVSEIEVIAKVPGEATPAWEEDATYTGGDAVFHDGSYHVAQWWTRDAPGQAVWGSWQETVRTASGDALWTPSRVFTAGDVVVHDGETYVAQWRTRNQEPGDAHGPWAAR